ncbi:Holliday junction-specific endonuclease [Mycoplasmopsis canis PG 14]|uniref:Holliday junction resolvase RecU n=1 Tax=Mycoplasmopsis canis TaxID=29555 RepID=A0A449AQN0_9BACT|nr:Holliday junction resolvase RecU [Mycoplasmopsis canis]AMD81000.1 Holliday junction resolvase RecU [Mycoplasmopsis canis PG 14]EIE40975.1 Holliday junction-specific endonuclease [Mycoplasmopsis canis PG 14]VEU68811.1 penicillin-binding protein-related factor A recombinase [Mycoplasmopsis canis]
MIKNRGMFLEKIINKTISYFWTNNYAFIEKKTLDISFNKVIHQKNHLIINKGYISKKSTVDYIGMFNGAFVCFEAKSCNENRFDLSNIKEHQIQYLNLINKNGGTAFVVLFFSTNNTFFKLNLQFLNSCISKGFKSISYEEIKKNSKQLFLEFPGILNIFE